MGTLVRSARSPIMRLGVPELLVILFIILLIFGANRVPQLMRGIGRGVKEFKDATKDPGEKPSNG
jgi:sec-independent protein translocase protein TatA